MKRLGVGAVACLASVVGVIAMSVPSQAVVLNLNSNLSINVPTVSATQDQVALNGFWNGTTGCRWYSDAGHRLQVYELAIAASGTYNYGDLSFINHTGLDIGVAVYTLGGFDPANPTANCVGTGDDSGTWQLNATRYTVVVTTQDPAQSGAGGFRLTGPGSATLSAATQPQFGGGSSGGVSVGSAPAPVSTLSLISTSTTCTVPNPSGVSGSWLTLPSASQCSQSGSTTKSGATLLGWSTNESFPVDRAQAQIDRQWGVIDEVIGGSRMIFIPAGMATFISGSNNLFPVWSR